MGIIKLKIKMSQDGDDTIVENMKREIDSPNTKGRNPLDIEGTLGGSVPLISSTPKPR